MHQINIEDSEANRRLPVPPDAQTNGQGKAPIQPHIEIKGLPKQTSPIPLFTFTKRIKSEAENPEEVARIYLNLYGKDNPLTLNEKEVQKLMPNVNLKTSKRLLKMFGIELENPTTKIYKIDPYKYILSTMTNAVTYKDFNARIKFAFDYYDEDGTGVVTKDALVKHLKSVEAESQFSLDEESIKKIIEAIFTDMGVKEDQGITFEKFYEFFSRKSKRMISLSQFDREKLTSFRVSRALSDLEIKASATEPVQLSENKFKEFFKNLKTKISLNLLKFGWLLLWIMGMGFMFGFQFDNYYDKSNIVTLALAKACAFTINLNLLILLTLITKTITTVFRRIGLARILPLNFNVFFHTIIGFTTLFLGYVHAGSHIAGNFVILANKDSPEEVNALFEALGTDHTFTEVKPVTWWLFASVPGITGILIIILMTIMVVFAPKKMRKKNYERFWYTHMFWLPVLILLCFHGAKEYFSKQYVIWFVAFPGGILILEKIYMLISCIWERFRILDLRIYSDIIELKVTKPSKYKYRAGQYALINIPEISKLQWHPFSYSSAPCMDYLSFHIAAIGDWTKKLKEYTEQYQQKKVKLPRIRMLGPYGTPSQHYSRYEHLMIFATGVGATPFASILQELIEKHKRIPNSKDFKVKFIDFYWVNRKLSSHKWMSKVFIDIQRQDPAGEFLKLHIFFTSPQSKYDIRSFFLWNGLSILHKRGVIIPGLEHFDIMHWGKPDWDVVFREKTFELQGRGRVGVFFCGNEYLAKELKKKCEQHSEGISFEFHKEIFG